MKRPFRYPPPPPSLFFTLSVTAITVLIVLSGVVFTIVEEFKKPSVIGYTIYMPDLSTTAICKKYSKTDCGVSAYDCEEGVDYLCQGSVIVMKITKDHK
jgi:hypothetical protein